MKKILTNKLYVSAIGVVVVFVVCLAYLFSAVLDTPLTSRPKKVVVEMSTTGGLYKGSAVTYRGVNMGKVSDIKLTKTGVEATLRITSSKDIPRNSLVKVRSLSPVGEQYLDFQPVSEAGPFLRNGARIPATSTDLPKTLASTVIAINGVLNQVDDKKLHSILTELSTGLAGTGQDLGRMTDQASLLLTDLQNYWPQTDRLLTNGGTVLDVGTDNAVAIAKLATSSKQFAAFLKDYDPELRSTLQKAPGQIKTLQALVADVQHVVPGFLRAGVSLTDLLASHDPHLRTLLQTYSPGIGVFGAVVKNGSLQINGIAQMYSRCDYGTIKRNPRDPRRAMVQDGRCAASVANLQRGAAHAPGPVR